MGYASYIDLFPGSICAGKSFFDNIANSSLVVGLSLVTA
jgi:hypothetical protein